MTPQDIDATTGAVLAVHPAKTTTDRSDRSVGKLVTFQAGGHSFSLDSFGSDPLGTAIYLSQMARKAEYVSATFRIMTGFALRAAKESLGVKEASRTDLSDDPRLANGWKGFCKEHLGISPDTAENWIKIAKVAEPKLKHLGGLEEVDLLNIGALDAGVMGKIEEAVAKITDGKQYTQLLMEWGIAKKARGAGAKGGNNNGGDDQQEDGEKPEGWTDEEWKEYVEGDEASRAAIDLWRDKLEWLQREGLSEKSWGHLPQRYLARMRETITGLRDLLPKK